MKSDDNDFQEIYSEYSNNNYRDQRKSHSNFIYYRLNRSYTTLPKSPLKITFCIC